MIGDAAIGHWDHMFHRGTLTLNVRQEACIAMAYCVIVQRPLGIFDVHAVWHGIKIRSVWYQSPDI